MENDREKALSFYVVTEEKPASHFCGSHMTSELHEEMLLARKRLIYNTTFAQIH